MAKVDYIRKMVGKANQEIEKALSLYPLHLLKKVAESGTKIYVLEKGETFTQVSPEVASFFSHDSVVVNAAKGVFAQKENTIYLRLTNVSTICHEFAHALDRTLGNGKYISFQSVNIFDAYSVNNGFVNSYAASNFDEFFAESIRAYLDKADEIVNLPANRKQLKKCNPAMFEICKGIFAKPLR